MGLHVNGGYPYSDGCAVPSGDALAQPYPYSCWRVNGFTNDGMPFKLCFGMPLPVYVNPSTQHPPIRVYSATETDFEHNGLAVLSPTSCTSSEDTGWELELTHPVDPDGTWKSLVEHRILKAPIKRRDSYSYQLFEIYRAVTTMAADGSMERVVNARHVFYRLNDCLLLDVRPTDQTCGDAITWMADRVYVHGVGDVNPAQRFTWYSDIDTVASAEYIGKSLTAALIGEDNCVLNRWGGELYRDNFYFSICARREHSKDNCFDISYGVDMTEIQEDVDYTDYCSRLVAKSSEGDTIVLETARSKAHHVTKYASFNYDDNYDYNQFEADANDYFAGVSTPSISYRVSYARLADTDLYAGFIGLQSCEVGDTGIIRNRVLDIVDTQKVIRKQINVLTDEVISIDLGNMPGSIARRKRYADTVTPGGGVTDKLISATDAKLQAIEIATISVDIHGMTSYPISTLQKYAIMDLEG